MFAEVTAFSPFFIILLDLKRALLWATEQGQPAQGARYLSVRASLAGLALMAVAVFVSTRLTTRAVTERPFIRADLELDVNSVNRRSRLTEP